MVVRVRCSGSSCSLCSSVRSSVRGGGGGGGVRSGGRSVGRSGRSVVCRVRVRSRRFEW